MDTIWNRLQPLKEKRSLGGWILWLLLLIWNLPSEWQNLTSWRQYVPAMTTHAGLISWLLAAGGVLWMLKIIMWPQKIRTPWLEIRDGQLKVQNTGSNPIFDVTVSIGSKAILASDKIPRIEANAWEICKEKGQPISRNKLGEAIVTDILSEGPQEITPAVVTYRDFGGKDRKHQLDLKNAGAGLAVFLPTDKK